MNERWSLTDDRAEAWIDVLVGYVAPTLLLLSGLLMALVLVQLDSTSPVGIVLPIAGIAIGSGLLGWRFGRDASAR
ncbi:hypothetical protein HFP89_10670 [Wenzhouxiangella sp. XN79A]|uniref:hypothetical protein n=1 Tax=Wenzhouxiangella sp. XN79A TaxID=2724193 RepID=UPI00144A683F|nr:hypothetical protein [Wenzhouxiangella sp. XN79A]NKI35627.1 hypothetical protein [Wenzhouxiangella sp. XN79A]